MNETDKDEIRLDDEVTVHGQTYRVRLEQDDVEADNPRDNDGGVAVIVASAPMHNLPQEGDAGLAATILEAIQDREWRTVERWLRVCHDVIAVLPIWNSGGYDVSLSAGEPGWAASSRGSIIGAVYMTSESVREGWSDQRPDELTLRRALIEEVDEYAKWANGEVYGCIVERRNRVNGQWEEVVSCWGFIGYDYAESAALDALRAELNAATPDDGVTAAELNRAARFLPQQGQDTRPCLTVAGVQVYAYVSDEGVLMVSVNLDDATEPLTDGDTTVPMIVTVGGRAVFAAEAEQEYDHSRAKEDARNDYLTEGDATDG